MMCYASMAQLQTTDLLQFPFEEILIKNYIETSIFRNRNQKK